MNQKKTPGRGPSKYAGLDQAIEHDNDEFIQDHHMQQQQIMNDQDKDLEALSYTVTTLGQMGQAINTELGQQASMLDDLGEGVDRTSGRLSNVLKRLNKLIDSANDRVQWCLIIALVLILVGLIIVVFYV